MTIDVRPADDADRYLSTDHLAWFDEVVDVPVEDELAAVPADQRFAAHVDDRPEDGYAGIYGVRPMQLGVPGARVPLAGLTWVGVHPDHRRRGVLTAMLTHHFEQCRDAGLALSALHASEPGIYGRFGYGLAALELAVDLGRSTTLTAPGLEESVEVLDVRLGPADLTGVAARMREVDLALAGRTPGMVVGEIPFYRSQVHERPHELRDKEPLRVLLAQHDGEDVGYAAFRRIHKWDNARPGGQVTVRMLHGEPATRLALLRRVLELDLMSTTTIDRVAPDDPLFAWVAGPRATGDVRTYDSTWVRLVDLSEAWAARTYDSDCDVVVEVSDRFAPWNAGRWRLVASGGEGRAERTDDEARVSLDADVLGAGYLGRSVAPLLGAGVVRESRDGAFLELARAMRTTLEPVPSTGF